MNDRKLEAWNRIAAGKGLEDLDLPKHGGRIDLRGIVLPVPSVTRTVSAVAGQFAVAQGFTERRDTRWNSVDFSGSHLRHLRLFGCEIVDCVFDECNCRDWRMWDTSFRNCTFQRADLRDSALGAVQRRRNAFVDVDFSGADLSGTMYTSAEFTRCLFKNAKLKKIDFQGSVFVDCVFEGALEEVLFYDPGFDGKRLPPNELLRTDFSRASFRYVEFRRLNLETVRFPEDQEHVVFERDFPSILDRLVTALKGKDDVPSRKLAAILGHKQKWLGSTQQRGVLSMKDIFSAGGQQGIDLVLKVAKDSK